MKAFRFVVILLVCFSARLNATVNAKPTPDDGSYTASASLDVEPSPFIDEENDYYSSLPELTRSRRNRGHGHHGHHGHHHAGFVAGAATGAVIANHNEPNYYAPTYYYPTTYYPSNSYYDGYYYY